jgi:hypothetical protein
MTNEIIDTISIGTPVWKFEENRRFYHPRGTEEAKMSCGSIYHEHFVRYEVIDETTKSWIVGTIDTRIVNNIEQTTKREVGKLAKNGKLTKHRVRPTFYTRQQMEDEIYVHENRQKIVQLVQQIQDANMLRSIVALITSQIK